MTLNRRNAMAAMAAGAGAALLGSKGLAGKARPNIIYILLDDAGWGDLSCYGQRRFETPNMDRLAEEGIKFTDHYAGSTVCAPSRCCLMTGLHTGHAYIRGNKGHKGGEGEAPMPEGTVTFPRLLQDAGYKTGAFGKWGLGYPGSSGDPVYQGFDKFFGYNCQSEAHNYYPDHLWDNLDRVELDGKTYAHDLIMEQAMDFVRQSSQDPFFCFMPVTIPHASLHVPKESSRPFRDDFWYAELTPGIYSGPVVRNPAAAFAGMMARLDGQIGDLLELVASLGIDDNTLVMLSSDNGPHKEGGHMPWLFDSNGPFRGYKRDLYEGGIRVPMLARWPGKIKVGAETDHISAFWDVMPTVCELAGVRVPEGIDGISFLPTLLGHTGKQQSHDYLYWEFHELGGRRAVREGDWKAVKNRVDKWPHGRLELYDLGADPGEKNDLARKHPERVLRMDRTMTQARTQSEFWG